ncbi:MAG TPA: hypothetical protein PLC99_24730 [Verrucomicrobiota bacterium]|nr:hypothetical protein [Verrucomicrobiota bacterium]
MIYLEIVEQPIEVMPGLILARFGKSKARLNRRSAASQMKGTAL